MQSEDFKKLMKKYFGNKESLRVVEENEEQVKMEVYLTIENCLNTLYWRKDEVDFCKRLETKNVKLLGYYYRVSPRMKFDKRHFYFMITDKTGEKYPVYFVLYKEDGNVVIAFERDPFFPKNKKHDDNLEVLEEEREIVKVIQMYYIVKFAEEER